MKNYILDTTVLLYDPLALFNFEDNNVIVPITVIEDVDRFKKEQNERGRNARQVSRFLDDMRSSGSLAQGVKFETGGILTVALGSETIFGKLPQELREASRSNFILGISLATKLRDTSITTILVTKDINLRIRADTVGLQVEDYESDKVDIAELYTGFGDITLQKEPFAQLESGGPLPCRQDFFPNHYFTVRHEEDPSKQILARYDAATQTLCRLTKEKQPGIWRITPRNNEQSFAMDALLNDSIQLVTLVGIAGTGKTLLAVAASIFKTVDESLYSRVLVSRPTLPMGKDIGFLPGNIEDKLTPWMSPIADNVEFLMHSSPKPSRQVRGFKELSEAGILVIEPLTFIRGRSIHNQFLIVDEAQNLTPHEIKTILTRAGEGTKIILTGDPHQIDNPYIDTSSNGLTYVVEKFKNQSIAAHITLNKGERSPLSELAANLL